jgi:hypothetical protein
MTVVLVGSSILTDLMGRDETVVLSPLMALAYFGFTAWLVLRKIFFYTERVSADTIQGAICAYLLMGLAWAFAYQLLAQLEPGSFAFSGAEREGAEHVENFIAFSFITLTTLGYGNIVPTTPRADALAYAEAVVGQIYLAVLLARLVALELTHHRGSEDA